MSSPLNLPRSSFAAAVAAKNNVSSSSIERYKRYEDERRTPVYCLLDGKPFLAVVMIVSCHLQPFVFGTGAINIVRITIMTNVSGDDEASPFESKLSPSSLAFLSPVHRYLQHHVIPFRDHPNSMESRKANFTSLAAVSQVSSQHT